MTRGLKPRDADGLIMTGCRNKEKSYSYSLLHLGRPGLKKKKKRPGPHFLRKQASHPKCQTENQKFVVSPGKMTSATEMAMQEQIYISQAQSHRGNAKGKPLPVAKPHKNLESCAGIGQRAKINYKLTKSGSSLLMATRSWLQGLF